MAFTWANIFAPPTGDSGLDNGTYADVDEWPFSDADDAYFTNDVTDSFTGIDLSSAGGDKKGFRVWIRLALVNATPTVGLSMRLLATSTEIWDGGVVATLASTTFKTFVFDIPDSAFSGDPAIDDLTVELTSLRNAGGNQRTRITGLRVSKSPFTAAQEASLPSVLGSADFACYRASDLALLGAADAEAVVVWPDASGNGRHLVRQAGTDITFEDDTEDYVAFGGAGARLMGHWGSRVTGNHVWHINVYPIDTTVQQAIWSYADEFDGVVATPTDPNDKNLLGIDDAGSGDKFLLMSGIGDAGAHEYGATSVTFDAWVRVTQWIQDSGNEHLWLNDDASPDVDADSGSNNLYTVSLGDRESDDRTFQGRITDFWIVDGAGLTEANIDDARDEWVNGAVADPIDLDHLTGSQFFSPTIADSSVDLTHLAGSEFFEIAVESGTAQVDLDHLDSSEFFEPLLAGTVDLTHLSGSEFFEPELVGFISTDTLEDGQFFEPTLAFSDITLDLLDGSQFFEPELGTGIFLEHFAGSEFFEPQIDGAIHLEHIDTSVFYSITVEEPGSPAPDWSSLPLQGIEF